MYAVCIVAVLVTIVWGLRWDNREAHRARAAAALEAMPRAARLEAIAAQLEPETAAAVRDGAATIDAARADARMALGALVSLTGAVAVLVWAYRKGSR